MFKRTISALLLVLLMSKCITGICFADQTLKVYQVPLFLEHYYEAGRASMGNKAMKPMAQVIERNGRATYTIYSKSMDYMKMSGKLTNLYIYNADKDSARLEALHVACDNEGYTSAFSFSRNQYKESRIDIAVWVDAMDIIASPDGYVPGAGEQNAKLMFDWSNAKVVTSNIKTTDLTILVNQTEVLSDTAPVIRNGRTMVPVRFISEALGLSVSWQGSTETVTIGEGNSAMHLKIGSSEITKANGAKTTIDSPAIIINSRTMVPIRAIAELSGAKVQWDGKTKTVNISD